MQIIIQDPPINLFDAVMAYRSQPMPTVDFKTPITTVEQGKAWIAALHAADLMFHFEDGPETIGNMVDGKWVDTFTKAQAKDVRKRVAELYDLDWATVGHECPIGYALEVMEPEQNRPTIDRMTEEYTTMLQVHHLPEVEAEELILRTDLTERQRFWLSTFMRRWEAVQKAEDAAHHAA